jgi:flagellar L-ring protein precursor FlgH
MSAWRAPIAAVAVAMMLGMPASGEEIGASPSFSGLASDRVAASIGDSLTILVMETSSASRSVSARGDRSANISAVTADGARAINEPRVGMAGTFRGAGSTTRADNLAAQISVSVEGIAPNGDLFVAGEQLLNIDGERTKIKLKGKVRRADISAYNTVPSSLLSNVAIDYQGSGFSTRSGRPGFLVRILNWLGIV